MQALGARGIVYCGEVKWTVPYILYIYIYSYMKNFLSRRVVD